jgi:hypothetical protein
VKIFLSYHSRQLRFAGELMKSLYRIGVEARTENLRTSLGQAIFDHRRLHNFLGNPDYVIVILSKSYVNDNWLQSELNVFKSMESDKDLGYQNKVILPVIFETCKYPEALKDEGRQGFDFRKSFEAAFKKLTSYISKNRQVFIVMKMNDKRLEQIYKRVMQPVIREFKYSKKRIDDHEDSGKISPRILKEITRSDIVLADLTGERPNCYYEAGFAEALGKRVILTARQGTNVHFDLRDNNFILWKDADDFEAKLRKRFEAISKEVRQQSKKAIGRAR